MEPREIDDYIMLGWYWASLRDSTDGVNIHGDYGVIYRIRDVFGYLKAFDLPVTVRAGEKVKQFANELGKKPEDAVLTPDEAEKLNELMQNWIQTFDAELEGRVAYEVIEKRLPVRRLLDDVGSLMAPGVFDSLSEIAQFDLIEAGLCLAYDMPTAAAFHLMRGTEAALRDFYCRVVKRNRVKSMMWGNMIQSMRSRANPPPAALLDNLDNIRENFRNPTQHPDARYDIDEAQNLFSLCVDVIDRMQKL